MTVNSDSSQEVVEATPDTVDTAATEVADNGSSEEQEQQEARTFTQEELDAKVNKRLAQEKRRWDREQQAKAVTPHPNPATPPRPEQFSTEVDYAKALIDHRATELLGQRETVKRQTEIEAAHAEREEEAINKYPDYVSVTQSDDLDISRVMAETIWESDIGPEIAYHLGKNPKEATRIKGLNPASQAREIGKIEAALIAKPAAKSSSSAPAPIKPVDSRSTSPKYSTSDPRSVKDTSASDWINARNKELQSRK